MIDRVPPQALDVERSVLGSMLVSSDCATDAIGLLTEQSFYTTAHQQIYSAIMSIVVGGGKADIITVSELLRKREQIQAVGSEVYLAELTEDVVSYAKIDALCAILNEKAALRSMIVICSDVLSKAYEPSVEAKEVVDSAQQAVFGVEVGAGTEAPYRSVHEILPGVFTEIEKAARGQVAGLKTGFADYDAQTTGYYPGQLIVVAARPGMGKTSFALCAAMNVAKSGGVVLFASLEMPENELVGRMLSIESRLSYHSMRGGTLPKREYAKLSLAATPLCDAKISIIDKPGLTPMDVMSRARRLKRQHGRLDLIIVDHIQLMRCGLRGVIDTRKEVSEVSRTLKEIAKSVHTPLVALSQLSRSCETRDNKRPQLSDLRESGTIEQDADMVTFIYRDEVYNDETEDKGIAELITGKNRSGPIGIVKVAFDGPTTTFRNLSSDHVEGSGF